MEPFSIYQRGGLAELLAWRDRHPHVPWINPDETRRTESVVHLAAALGDKTTLSYLILDQGISPNIQRWHGPSHQETQKELRTPLIEAMLQGQEKAVRFFMDISERLCFKTAPCPFHTVLLAFEKALPPKVATCFDLVWKMVMLDGPKQPNAYVPPTYLLPFGWHPNVLVAGTGVNVVSSYGYGGDHYIQHRLGPSQKDFPDALPAGVRDLWQVAADQLHEDWFREHFRSDVLRDRYASLLLPFVLQHPKALFRLWPLFFREKWDPVDTSGCFSGDRYILKTALDWFCIRYATSRSNRLELLRNPAWQNTWFTQDLCCQGNQRKLTHIMDWICLVDCPILDTPFKTFRRAVEAWFEWLGCYNDDSPLLQWFYRIWGLDSSLAQPWSAQKNVVERLIHIQNTLHRTWNKTSSEGWQERQSRSDMYTTSFLNLLSAQLPHLSDVEIRDWWQRQPWDQKRIRSMFGKKLLDTHRPTLIQWALTEFLHVQSKEKYLHWTIMFWEHVGWDVDTFCLQYPFPGSNFLRQTLLEKQEHRRASLPKEIQDLYSGPLGPVPPLSQKDEAEIHVNALPFICYKKLIYPASVKTTETKQVCVATLLVPKDSVVIRFGASARYSKFRVSDVYPLQIYNVKTGQNVSEATGPWYPDLVFRPLTLIQDSQISLNRNRQCEKGIHVCETYQQAFDFRIPRLN